MTENLNIPSDDNLKNFNKIIGTLENSLKIDPKDHNLYISLGDEYLKLKRFDLAFKSYLSAYKLQPRNADISVCIGVFHREVGNYNDAASALLHAIELDKNCIKAYVDLSDVYFNFANHDGVIRRTSSSDFYTQSLALGKSWVYPLSDRIELGAYAVLGQILLNGEYQVVVLPTVIPVLKLKVNLF